MKYTYAYKTSDGVRHEESMDAASREQVFAALRTVVFGLRSFFVSKFNSIGLTSFL